VGALDDRYLSAVSEILDQEKPRETLLPAVLAASCVRVLPVEGAGLSVSDVLRVPLGASDHTACMAERLQSTLGEGPCLTAMAEGRSLVADLRTIESTWPVFHASLLEQTPYRSVASVPLRQGGQPFGALDLYSEDPGAEPFQTDERVRLEIGEQISAILSAAPVTSVSWSDDPVASWLGGPEVERRMGVWRAVGVLVAGAAMDQMDALAVLRGYAFAHHQTLDEVARLVCDGALTADDVTADA
jgi:hypothetical protein